MAQICENGKTKFDLIKPKYNELWTASNFTGQIQLNPRFVHQKKELQTHLNPSKKPENWTCLARNEPNPAGPNLEKPNFEPRFAYQNLTTNPPELSKNPEFQTQELGSTQH